MISLQKSKSDFFNRRALFIGVDKVSVYHWDKGGLGNSYLFDIDDIGRNNFERYLNESENTPMSILVDIVEEEFRQDTIPHVFGSDRASLIERKLSRLFGDTRYVYVQNQGREEEGRRDDRLLFMALTKQEILSPWVALLEKYKVPLKGILSVPLLLQSYVKALPDISDHALVITMQSISGLRQTFFHKKELKFSRLSKLFRYGIKSYAPRIESEAEKIQRYLNSLRLIPNDTLLDVYIIADKPILDELAERPISSAMMKRHYYDVNTLLATIQQGVMQTAPFSDQLLIGHLLKYQVKNCYASSTEMRYLKLRNIRYSMNAASIALLLFGFIYSSIYFIGGFIYKQESEAAKNKAQFYQARYDLAKKRFLKTPLEPDQIKVAVDAVETLKEYKASPYQMMAFLGKVLEQYPAIRLDKLDWRFSLDPNKEKEIEDNNNAMPSTEMNDVDKVKYYQISNINVHVVPFDGNYRAAIATVNTFVDTLLGYDVVHSASIESLPLDISSKASLQGNAKSISKTALFSLRVVIGVN